MFSLNDKIIVVTGALGLIGRETCMALVRQGATVVASDVNEHEGKLLQEELNIGKDTPKSRYINLDITNERQVTDFIDCTENEVGEIQGWVNLAYPRTDDWGRHLEDVKLESWRSNIDMQLNSQFICCREVLERMKIRKRGAVVNFSSIYGLNGPNFNIYEGTDMTTPAAYSVIKAGITNFTKYLATYYGKDNLRINAVAPGGIFDNQNSTFVKNYSKMTPLGRMGLAKEIAPAVVFLVSDEAGYITGQTLVVDGGFTSW